MSYSSSLIDNLKPLVLDTSVLINLHACAYGEQILAAIPNDIIVPQVVTGELDHETSRIKGEHKFLYGLAASGFVEVEDFTEEELEIFYQLTSNYPSLDDGEAATIAIAAKRNALPVVDEKRGRARAMSLVPALEPKWSLDILRHPFVIDRLGNHAAAEALYLALKEGRMRIPAESADYVIGLIGIERSVECLCLPGYRERFGKTRRILEVGENQQALDHSD